MSITDSNVLDSLTNIKSRQLTPVRIENLPGSDSLKYRVGTHDLFKASMYYDLVSKDAFRQISNRDDDLSVSLIDCWAMVSDVLTFYQERIANEGFLRTSKERLSVLELSKFIGRKLRHGLAATTFLAFTLDDIPDKITRATIDIKTRVQSLPEQGELPQVFETVEKFDANSEWNSVKPKLTEKQYVLSNSKEFVFDGISTGLRPGDDILIVVSKKNSEDIVDKIFLKIIDVKIDQKLQTTTIIIDSSSQNFKNIVVRDNNEFDLSFYSFENQVGLFGHNADHKLLKQKKYYYVYLRNSNNYTKYLRDVLDSTKFHLKGFKYNLNLREIDKDPRYRKDVKRILGSYRRRLFYEVYYTVRDFSMKKNRKNGFLYLDNTYPDIVPNNWIVLKDQEKYDAYKVNEINSISLNDFELNYKVNVLRLDELQNLDQYELHETSAYIASKKLTLARVAIPTPINNFNHLITLEKKLEGLKEKRYVSVTGELENDSKTKSEISQIITIQNNSENTVLEISPLENSYKRDTVAFNFNVVKATHGETRHEILGSGDPSQSRQKFVLKGKPVTYVLPDIKESGSTLEVRVGDELWQESDNFLSLKSSDKSYVTQVDDDGNFSLIFGNGAYGMRPPMGIENIHANYRLGMGKDGMVNENQLNLLLNRSLGVRSVTNPVSATNATDPEDLNTARKNAPIKLLTMNRIISLSDFKDYAESFEGVEKALAMQSWDGLSKIVHLVIADSKGQNADSILRKSLELKINSIKDSMIQFRFSKFKRKTFNVKVKVLIDEKHQFEKIKPKVIQELSKTFSFEARQFGQDVTLSEVMSTIQKIKGILAVDIDKLYETEEKSQLKQIVSSSLRPSTRHHEPIVDLLTINTEGVIITEILQ
ncbi:MAG: hypothetical protein OEM77_05585 [Nitrosopumilus sp.]|nr:hypothetical protein [Nitrosopumilus sp.]MDH3735407.1 hypothetical protein [Nitrosopumilus sp.]MDH3822231.1 hypothetical protein [Nitrosopumilus sp.]MDH3832559.1 hypothetical protein [Nitrosopumilus sp.]